MKSLSLSQPHLLIMVGLPGSGKSFFAEKFSEMFRAPYVNYDKIAEISKDNDLSAKYMAHFLHELFKTGHTIIVDGLADTRTQRAELKHLAHTAGYKPLYIWVQTDEATAKARKLKALKGDRHGAEYEYDKLASSFAVPVATERPFVVISGKHTYATQAKAVLKNLATPRASSPKDITPERDRHQQASKRNITIQ
jgi:predicted kinase